MAQIVIPSKDRLKLFWPYLALLVLLLAWLLIRHPLLQAFCSADKPCWLLPDSWPELMGITASSSPWLVGLLAFALFALPFGRSGLLANLVAIHLAQPVFGLAGVVVIFLVASVVSIFVVHEFVRRMLEHKLGQLARQRLSLIEKLVQGSLRTSPELTLTVGNLVGSQWQMSALSLLAKVPTLRAYVGLFLGNLAGFVLVLALSQVPQLDAVSLVFTIVLGALALSSPWLLQSVFAADKKKA